MTEQANTLPFVAYVQTTKKEIGTTSIAIGDLLNLTLHTPSGTDIFNKISVISVSDKSEHERIYVAHDTKTASTVVIKTTKHDVVADVIGGKFTYTDNNPLIKRIAFNQLAPIYNINSELRYEGERNVKVFTPIKAGDVFVHRDRSSEHTVEHVCADGSLVVTRVTDKKGGIRQNRSIMIRRTDVTMLAALSPSLVWKSGKVD